MISDIKPKLNPLISIIAKPFSFIHPNILSLVGMIFPILFLYFMTQHKYVIALCMLIGTAFDTLDGAVARMTNRITRFGALLDSTLDRLADALVIIGFHYAGLVPLEVVLIVFIESFLISYIRSRAELADKGNLSLAVGIIERPERILIIGLAVLAAIFMPTTQIIFSCTLTQTIFIILAILSLVTILQRIYVSYKKL
jgi:phosphatidylglycerophosphate synthase